MPTLRFLSPVSLPKIGHEVRFDVEQVTLGSSNRADIVLREPSVSPLHARLTVRDNGILIEDLGSENGLYIGTKRVLRYLLDFHQLFRIGRVALQLLPDGVLEQATAELVQLPDVAPNPPLHVTQPLPLVSPPRTLTPWVGARPSRYVRAPSRGPAWLLGLVAASVTACVFIALPFEAKPTVLGSLGFLWKRSPRLYTVNEGDRERTIPLDKQADLLVPSAAVTDPLHITVKRLAKPPQPPSRLFANVGSAWSVAFDEPAKLVRPLLYRFQGVENARVPHFLGWNDRDRAGYSLSLVSLTEPIKLRNSIELFSLSLSAEAEIAQLGRYLIVSSSKDENRQGAKDEAMARLDAKITAYSRLDYPLPATPLLVVLDDDLVKKQPARCRSYLALRREHSTWTERELEKSLFAAVASAGFDCERVNRASFILSSLFDVLSQTSATTVAPAFEIERLPIALALQPKEREVLDVGRQFFGYVMRDERAKGLLLSALSSRQLTVEGETSADHVESEIDWISGAIEEVIGQTLTAAWEQFLDQRISVELRKSRAAESCPTKAALHWEATADAYTARLVCSPVYAMGG